MAMVGFAEIDSMIKRRGEDGNTLKEALEFLEERRDENNLQVMARLCRVYWHSGDLCTTDTQYRAEMWRKGVETGKIAVGIQSDRKTILELMPHHWYATNLGSHAKMVGLGVAATYLKPLYQNACEAVKLNKEYDGGGPLRVLARYLLESPPWPVGHQDKKKGLQYTEDAYECDPSYIVNCLETGDILAFSQKDPTTKERGMKLLLDALERPVPQENPYEFLKYRGSILRILEKNKVRVSPSLMDAPSCGNSRVPAVETGNTSNAPSLNEHEESAAAARPQMPKDAGVSLYPASEMILAVGFNPSRDYFDIF